MQKVRAACSAGDYEIAEALAFAAILPGCLSRRRKKPRIALKMSFHAHAISFVCVNVRLVGRETFIQNGLCQESWLVVLPALLPST